MKHKSGQKNIPVIPAATLDTKGFRLLPLIPEQVDSYEMHRHDCFQLFWINEGHGTAQIDFQGYSFYPNTLCLISPGRVHGLIECKPDKTFSGWLLVFSKELLVGQQLEWPHTSLIDLMEGTPFHRIAADQATIFNTLFSLLEREQEIERKEQLEAVNSYLRLILIEMSRIQDSWQQRHREEAGFRLTKEFFTAVESHYRTVHSVSEYASMLHVSSNHLNESIKKTLGKSAGKVLRDRQLLEAKRLLRYSNAHIAEIASYLGFRDSSYFGRYFKKNIGVTPTSFRKG
ncbi:helix-turn-helix domain-containing protein [Shouchella clausii]|uniref:helix-turn-helix domain-containing protein n=1 Tax=Shouchella clausii TaxID=79880 RepID=UPI000B963517|nr:AraC family transcriptional regulator [Shouchella clausii]AST97809.1 hypothetical protein BC8716_18345 [Shouchella clausii]MCR1287462.1 AraC family transcriptional regulator [Shouchella clausii]MEB5474181.1 AraC family transcriptional regulator [Shouchella clausii]QNM44249.1 helix-turn-helix domain-containing protein [Shouchella clausii]WQG97064.1 AraC family transcriptional regulator [Shouchella clausii]